MTAAVVQALVEIVVVAAVHVRLGDYMARVYTYFPAFALGPLADGLH